MMENRGSDPKASLSKSAIEHLLGVRGVAASSKQRAEMTISCRDTDYMPKVKDAGIVKQVNGTAVQVMHNGLLVKAEGYQGRWQAEVIKKLQGNHEPQEEKVFYEVLKRIDSDGVMIELGSWWSYYSMWYLKTIQQSKAICCEPDPDNIKLGKFNMKLNGFSERDASFYQVASGSKNGKKINFTTEKHKRIVVPIKTVDRIVQEAKIDRINILHLDIQGAELDALHGALESIRSGKVRFLFVSTHHYAISGDPLIHQKCLNLIKKNGGYIISKHTIAESCSGDGLIVASFSNADRNFHVPVSIQHTDESLFREPEKDLDILWRAHDKLAEANIQTEMQKQRIENDYSNLNSKFKWINAHPFRFFFGNLYHVYIKRDRQVEKT